jgi:hypothetical protein
MKKRDRCIEKRIGIMFLLNKKYKIIRNYIATLDYFCIFNRCITMVTEKRTWPVAEIQKLYGLQPIKKCVLSR